MRGARSVGGPYLVALRLVPLEGLGCFAGSFCARAGLPQHRSGHAAPVNTLADVATPGIMQVEFETRSPRYHWAAALARPLSVDQTQEDRGKPEYHQHTPAARDSRCWFTHAWKQLDAL